jgi:hypothetical protein
VDLWLGNAQALGHLFVEEAFALAVGLHPFAVNDELGDGATSRPPPERRGTKWSSRLANDFLERQVVLLQEALGQATVRTPESGIDEDFHKQEFR